jgi:cation/acetate symporter
MRYYTTPSVRDGATFGVLDAVLHLSAVCHGTGLRRFCEVGGVQHPDRLAYRLAPWVASWGKVGLVKIEDINADGILQLAELSLNSDAILLLTPEIAGLPYVVSGLVAAGVGGGAVDG